MADVQDIVNLMVGTGNLKINDEEVGAFSNASISISRETLKHISGVPRTTNKVVILDEEATFSANIEEINLTNLEYALGATHSGGTITFGKMQTPTVVSLELDLPRDDGTLIIGFWRAQNAEGFDWSIADDTWHNVPVAFEALSDPCNDNALGFVQLVTT